MDYKQFIKAARASSAPDMNPQPYEKKSQRRTRAEPPPVPDISEVGLSQIELYRARLLVAEAVEQKMIRRTAKRVEDKKTEGVKKILERVGKVTAMVGETRMAYYPTSRRSISGAILMQLGVSAEVIRKATVENESWTLKLLLPGEDETVEE